MLYILLTIIISVLLLLIFKAFQKYGVNSLVAIVVNYITAGITGILFFNSDISINAILASDWIYICLPLGLLFICIFYLIALTTHRISISAAAVANKMSVIMPVLYSIIFLNQHLSALKIVGIVLAMLAVYLSTRSSQKSNVSSSLIWLPVLVFVGSGLIDIAINASNAFYIHSKGESALFSICTFLSAFVIGIIILLYSVFVKRSLSIKEVVAPKNIIGGLVLGIPNYFSIFFIFKSLDANVLQSAQLFPVLNLSNVALSAFLGWLIFKEKLSPINLAGIALAIISILLISF
ncbi:MAG: EamA/RhaT family transporter [Bacteroidetes bacterium]|nr:EamA/RhaT family transporter [Bacteroidota bacterium]